MCGLNRAACILLGCLVGSAVQADDNAYTMADLKSLANDGSWQELIQHLEDIKPSSRNEEWSGLVNRAGVAFLTSLSSTASVEEVVLVGLRLSLQYPVLKENDDFSTLYLSKAEELYSACFRYGSAECSSEYAQTLELFHAPAGVTFAKGKLAFRQISKTSAVPFFALAVKDSPSYCSEPELGESVLDSLSRPKSRYYQMALDVATKGCKGHKLEHAESYLKHSFEVQTVLCEDYIDAGFVKGISKKVCELVLEG